VEVLAQIGCSCDKEVGVPQFRDFLALSFIIRKMALLPTPFSDYQADFRVARPLEGSGLG